MSMKLFRRICVLILLALLVSGLSSCFLFRQPATATVQFEKK